MTEVVVSIGAADNMAALTRVVRTQWPKFVRFLHKTPAVTDDKTAAGWYCPASFEPGYRSDKNLQKRYCLTFDYDSLEPGDVSEVKRSFSAFEHVLYTTASHTPEAPRLRLVLPLSRPVSGDEFRCITRTVGDWYNLEKLARESDKPAQMMFLPTRRPDGEYWFEHNKGELIDVDEILEQYTDWTDPFEWPRRAERDSLSTGKAANPLEKPGIVGDFCRTFSIPEAIARFELPYLPGSTPDRYTYADGSRPDGARLYDGNTKLHSEHDTDPAHGQQNAFDLVRLHKFSPEKDDPNATITETASYKAMCDMVRKLPEVAAEQTRGEFENLDVTEPLDAEYEPPDDGSALRFEFVPAPEFVKSEPLEWLIKNVIPKAEIAVVYGQSGTGKSFFVLDLCAAIATGSEWQGHAVKKGRIGYVVAEGARGFRSRIDAYSHHHDIDLIDLGLMADAPNLLERKDVTEIIRAVRKFGDISLIVLDTLAASMPGGDENAGKDMNRLVNYCKAIHKKTGALVLLVHHAGKDTTKGARGWSGLRAAADVEIEVTRVGKLHHAKLSKLKDGDDGRQWTFKLQQLVLGLDADGDELTSCIVEYMKDTPRINQKGPTGLQARNIMNAMEDLGRGGEPVHEDKIIEQASQMLVKTGKRDTRKQQVSRALSKMLVEGQLHRVNKRYVSVTPATQADREWFDE